MPHTVSLHQIEDLAKGTEKNQILLQTKLNTELLITVYEKETVITIGLGNEVELIHGKILIIKEKN